MNSKPYFLPDLFITLPVIFLLCLGILIIYSSNPQMALQQAILAIVGLIIFTVISLLDFKSLFPSFKYLYFLSIISLLIVFILGTETRGSLRWIQIFGWQFQPSEFAKFVIILFLAKFWTQCLPTWFNIIKSFLWILPILLLVFRQPDLGTTLTLLMIWVVMLVGANVSFLKFVFMSTGALVSIPIIWLFLKDYQKDRISSFLSPAGDPLGVGYNVIQSMIAVGSGQLLGRGLGHGTQSRLQFLPEFRTDFIFASIVEELGFIGSLVVLGLYGTLVGRSLWIISNSDRFGGLVVLGVLGMLFFQIVVNIGMNIGIVPITGITLPLLSLGGSSLIITLASLGLVVSVARWSRQKNVTGGERLD